jgi:hypothetical protein
MCSDDKKLERIVSGEFSVTKLIAGLQSGNAQPQVSPSSTYPTTASAMGAYF